MPQSTESGLGVRGRHAEEPVSIQLLAPWMTWLCLLGANVWFIHRFGTNSPFQNEWRLVPAAFGQASPDYASLPRLMLTFLYRATGPDFRAGMFASLALLAAWAAAMMMVSRSVRGRADWSDAVYPLLLLNWGHFGTLLVSGQLHVALVTMFAGLILVIIASDVRATSSAPSPPTPLPGGEGRNASPATALAVGEGKKASPATPLARGEGRKGWQGVIVAHVALLASFGLLLWSAGELLGQTNLITNPSRWPGSVTEFLALGTGSMGRQWPLVMGGMIALGFIGGFYMLVRRCWKQPGERGRLLGLVAWAVCFAFVAFCDLPQGQWRKPVTLAVLGPCWIMLVLAIYGRSTFARFIPRLATLTGLALLWPWPVVINGGYFNVKVQTNTSEGLEQGEALKKQFDAMQSDIDAGLPQMVIAYRFSRPPNRIGPRVPEHLFAHGLSLLWHQRIGMFVALQPDPDYARLPGDRVARESGNHHFDFAGGRHIYGAWVKLETAPTAQPTPFEMSWKRLHGSPPSGSYRATVPSNSEDLLVWIDETIVEADLACDRKAVHILSVDFLVPRLAASGGVR
jgi:hypothetical protein